MDLIGKKVLVAGCGKSGIGSAGLLRRFGAVPVLYDANEKLDAEKLRRDNGLSEETEVITGEVPEELFSGLSLAVLSPGVPADGPLAVSLRRAGIPVWGEVELAWHYGKGRLIAITGTNGKTTTTALVGEILKKYSDSAFVVGNIGIPYTQEARNMTEKSVTVAEISSFQLETTADFHPEVSAILNITPDHLNRHHTMENYAAVKESITKNQGKSDFCVLNREDPYLSAFGETCPARVIWFSSARKLTDGYYLDGETICRNLGEGPEALLNVNEMNLKRDGGHRRIRSLRRSHGHDSVCGEKLSGGGTPDRIRGDQKGRGLL